MLDHLILQKTRLARLAPLVLSALLITQVAPVAASDHGHHKVQAKFNQAGELARPANIKEWISIGASVTPKDMNNGKPAFPEFHYVYLDHASWSHWKKTGEFREGAMIAKELVSVGSKSSASGSGYFAGDYVGPVAVSVKDSKRFAKSNNWGYFVFGDDKALSAPADESCVACHKANAAQDMVFTQYWAPLRAVSPKK
ncbi:MAG: cytochrome P460 family protein [Nitrosomonadaceae bacterium]